MVNTQHRALRLANALESGYVFDKSSAKLLNQAAIELRRLHEMNYELLEALTKANNLTGILTMELIARKEGEQI